MMNTSLFEMLLSLKSSGYTILTIIVIYILFRLTSSIFRWIWRSLILPLFSQRRAYFRMLPDDDVFYLESPLRFMGFRLNRNKRWALKSAEVGYVSRKRGSHNQDQNTNDIYFTGFGWKERVGQAKVRDDAKYGRICEIVCKLKNEQGDEFNNNPPVGFINQKGEVYKYFANRASAIKEQRLGEPVLIGFARSPEKGKRVFFKTNGERTDAEVVPYIEDTNADDEWMFFQKRKKSKVKARYVNSSNGIIGRITLWAGGWRVLHAHTSSDGMRKYRPWGIGYVVEDFWRGFRGDAQGFGLDSRAVAAMLLMEREGFVPREDERLRDDRKGLAPTALISLVTYLILFPLFDRWEGISNVFPFMGPDLSKVAMLILLFFAVWVLIFHTIRMLLYNTTDKFESLLSKINNNVGSTGWNTLLIVVCIIGFVCSIFFIDYTFFPIFLAALIAVVVNRTVFVQRKWEVENPLEKVEETDEDEHQDTDGEEVVEHDVMLTTALETLRMQFKVAYKTDKLKELRSSNPFREGNFGNYSQRVCQMIQNELGGDIYSKLDFVSSRINRFALENHLSYVETINLILKIAQPNNISYVYDCDSPELLPQPDEPQPEASLLENRTDGIDGKGYKEYCRYPSETLHDKHGDCDCHAALAVGLLSACGYRCCYLTNDTNDGTGHAALGIEMNENLKSFTRTNNCFTYQDIQFIYVEATGNNCQIGEVPSGFEAMLKKNDSTTFAIIEPLSH